MEDGDSATDSSRSGRKRKQASALLASLEKRAANLWTQAEDNQLLDVVLAEIARGTNESVNWANITKLGIWERERTAKQYRERYQNHLDPRLDRSPWTDEEDNTILDYQREFGNCWAAIARLFGNARTQHTVKNRYFCLRKIYGLRTTLRKTTATATQQARRQSNPVMDPGPRMRQIGLTYTIGNGSICTWEGTYWRCAHNDIRDECAWCEEEERAGKRCGHDQPLSECEYCQSLISDPLFLDASNAPSRQGTEATDKESLNDGEASGIQEIDNPSRDEEGRKTGEQRRPYRQIRIKASSCFNCEGTGIKVMGVSASHDIICQQCSAAGEIYHRVDVEQVAEPYPFLSEGEVEEEEKPIKRTSSGDPTETDRGADQDTDTEAEGPEQVDVVAGTTPFS